MVDDSDEEVLVVAGADSEVVDLGEEEPVGSGKKSKIPLYDFYYDYDCSLSRLFPIQIVSLCVELS